MSIRAINWAIEQPVKSSGKLVLIVLANRANDDGRCWPSNASLCADTGLSERCVRDALHQLRAAGAIESIDRAGSSTLHMLTFGDVDPGKICPPAKSAPRHQMPPPPANPAPPPRQILPPTPANPAPITQSEPKERTPSEPKLSTRAVIDGFEEFWAAYPRKAGKGAARVAYLKAIGKTDARTLLDGVLAAQWPAAEKYIPHPATWLNQERWLDEIEPYWDPALKAAGLDRNGHLPPAYTTHPQLRIVGDE